MYKDTKRTGGRGMKVEPALVNILFKHRYIFCAPPQNLDGLRTCAQLHRAKTLKSSFRKFNLRLGLNMFCRDQAESRMMFLARKLAPAVLRPNNLMEGPKKDMSETEFDAWRDEAAMHFAEGATTVRNSSMGTRELQSPFGGWGNAFCEGSRSPT
jgi:hypothetical protein